MGKKENVEIALGVTGADESRQDIEKVEKAFEAWGDSGAKLETQMVRAFKAIDEKAEKASNNMAAVTARDVTVMAKNFHALEAAIEASGKSITEFPQEVQAALKKAEAQVKHTTAEFGKMQDSVADNAVVGKAAGDQWAGLGNALESVGGKAGKAVAGVGLFGAALKEGIGIGMQANALFKTDMSEWDKSVSRFGEKMNGIMKSWADNLVATGRLMVSLFSGDLDEIKTAFKEYGETGVDFFRKIGDAATKHGADWDKHAESISGAKAAADAAAVATENLAKQTAALAKAAAKAAEEEEKLRQAHLLATSATDALINAIKAEAGVLAEKDTALEKAVKNAEAILASNALLTDAERLRLTTLVQLGKETSALVDAQNQLNTATSTTTQVVKENQKGANVWLGTQATKQGQINAEIAIRAELATKIEEEKKATEGLVISTNKIVAVTKDNVTTYTNLAEAETKAADAAGKVATSVDKVTDSTGKARIVISNTAQALEDLGDGKFGTSIEVIGGVIDGLEERAAKLEKTMRRLAEAVRATTEAANQAAE